MDVLSGVLTGSAFLAGMHGPYQTEEKSSAGHLFIALHIAAFQPLTEFLERIERFIAELKAVPLARGFSEVFYPEELEARNDVKNRQSGLELPGGTWADLRRIARETGLEFA